MKIQTRRAVALIALCLIADQQPGPLFDHQEGAYFPFSGKVTKEEIDVYDLTDQCSIQGKMVQEGNFSLFHNGNHAVIDLIVTLEEFSGFDYNSNKRFEGTGFDKTVSLFDYEGAKYQNFSL